MIIIIIISITFVSTIAVFALAAIYNESRRNSTQADLPARGWAVGTACAPPPLALPRPSEFVYLGRPDVLRLPLHRTMDTC